MFQIKKVQWFSYEILKNFSYIEKLNSLMIMYVYNKSWNKNKYVAYNSQGTIPVKQTPAAE